MKTSIRKLNSVTHNDTAATKLINDNFEVLQQGIEDALSRSGKTPNFMDAELDMNTRRIINCGDPIDDNDVVTVKWFKDTIVDIDALENKVDQEIIDRTNADSALQNNINIESARAQAAEGSINNTLSTFGNIVTHNADEFATAGAISNMQVTTNLVTSVSSSSTDSQYPSAKLFYDTCGDIETLINAL